MRGIGNVNSAFSFSREKKDKVGNAIRFFGKHISSLSKTKVLKLIYFLDEHSIKKYGIPFFNFDYKLWKNGPVEQTLFNDLSDGKTVLFVDYLDIVNESDQTWIEPKGEFNDDEFSDAEIEILEEVTQKLGHKTATYLCKLTHREGTPWWITAEEQGIRLELENEQIKSTEYIINVASLIEGDAQKKAIYTGCQEIY